MTLGAATDSPETTTRIWLGGRWFRVVGILEPFELASEIDQSALIGLPIASADLGHHVPPGRIYVRADTTRIATVAAPLARAANPAHPEKVTVSRPSDALVAASPSPAPPPHCSSA